MRCEGSNVDVSIVDAAPRLALARKRLYRSAVVEVGGTARPPHDWGLSPFI
jgi:hypothetical protein